REFEQQLLGIVSHDLRTPLSAILVGTQTLLRREGLDERGTAAVTRIQRSAERGVRMVRDLLDFTQARLGGGIQVTRRPLDLHALVRSVVEELEAVYPEREVRLMSEGKGEGAWDSDRLAQVVSNLVSNALKYSPRGTPVEVRTVGEDGSVTLQVHNAGEPIAPGLLSRIFEPMQRGSAQVDLQSLQSRSVGLGLYIVRHLVQAHGGTIDVRSTAEEGTTFTVRLPRNG
ncbi:MAG: HAMP domain-containing histidine kinase, partial [Myxococcaceae bacterium]|nr:HAMP domain-containing histidine kinase [Myxococcaceae bacterium]